MLCSYNQLFGLPLGGHQIEPQSSQPWKDSFEENFAKALPFYTRALCQKNEGSVKTQQRSVKMDGRTTYRTLSPKRTPFQIGTD
jgi:hypothetical protein